MIVETTPYCGYNLLTRLSFPSRFMDRYRFLTDRIHAEMNEGSGKAFSLTIRSDLGCILLETRAQYMHQAFQRLIDWSAKEISQDVCAIITGPNGFYANHRIKASRDFGWVECEEALSETSLQL